MPRPPTLSLTGTSFLPMALKSHGFGRGDQAAVLLSGIAFSRSPDNLTLNFRGCHVIKVEFCRCGARRERRYLAAPRLRAAQYGPAALQRAINGSQRGVLPPIWCLLYGESEKTTLLINAGNEPLPAGL